MIEVRLRLFGAFRSYSGEIKLEVEKGVTVEELKPLIAKQLTLLRPDLNKANLVYDSAIADEREILRNDDRISAPCALAILPPVCGG